MSTNNQIHYAVGLHQAGQINEAADIYKNILDKNPNDFNSLHLLGVIEFTKHNYDKAEKLISSALQINPNSHDAHFNLANIYAEKQEYQYAIAEYERAIELQPNFLSPYINLGNAKRILKNHNEAIKILENGLKINPLDKNLIFNIARVYFDREELSICIEMLLKVLIDEKFHYEANHLIAVAYAKSNDLNRAEDYFKICSILKKKSIHFEIQLCKLSYLLGKYEQTIDKANEILKEDPKNLEILFIKAEAHEKINQKYNALEIYEKIYAINQNFPNLMGALLSAKYSLFNYENIDKLNNEYINLAKNNYPIGSPFTSIDLCESGLLQKQIADTFVHAKILFEENQKSQEIHQLNTNYHSNKIKLGFFSPDLNNHSVGRLLVGFFEHLNRNVFEVYCFDMRNVQDHIHDRIKRSADNMIYVTNLSDSEIINLCKKINLDIAIDLAGHTLRNRPKIFSTRVAPIQINFLGYPGTVGGNLLDYIILDKFIAEVNNIDEIYSEKPLLIEGCFQPNDSSRYRPISQYSPSNYGLPEDKIILACFNETRKISLKIMESWMQILIANKETVLWLLDPGEIGRKNLYKYASSFDIDLSRFYFSNRMPLSDYLERFRSADLFLDTFPFNGGTVVSDALWSGLPVITMEGNAFASRMAGSLLNSLNLNSLIAKNIDDYIKICNYLVSNPSEISNIKNYLSDDQSNFDVFNSKLYCERFESLLVSTINAHSI